MKNWVLLASVLTEVEADIIIGLLEQENISTRKAYPGIGNLKATYGLLSGVEIYVPAAQASIAKEILSADGQIFAGSLEQHTENEEDE